ncbi:hypothetical protein [Thermococcus celer]|uniref:Succinate dehydrogenase n=1 Tax=Thermococcus celer Vu 13 = JCM 8558 TaxID=1293037 RepID=A0A218P0Y0_THECE|nr:hypothetical protein [Thermococcus celer]ASI98591.1 hypothetical protein A3L02_02910 [Thermococcus celer Vu 13 = JCM 8558]
MRAKTAVAIVEWTSLPLLLFAGLMVISGYGLTSEAARNASLGLLTFSRSRVIHLSRMARLSFVSLLLLHTYAGTEILAKKVEKSNGRLARLVEYSVLAFLLYVGWIVFNGELD